MTQGGSKQHGPDVARLQQMIGGGWVSQVVRAVAHHAIADVLADGPASAARIAASCATEPAATARLMRACVPLGLATYNPQEGFAATP